MVNTLLLALYDVKEVAQKLHLSGVQTIGLLR